jgi:adenosylcobinamide-GDP ribazoletransferase
VVLTATKGALGFLTRLPTGRTERAWTAFRETPAAFPLAGWMVGALAAVPLVVAASAAVPAPTAAFGYLLALYAVTGINHADGVADLGDAAVVHGDPGDRRAVLKDTEVGVGAALALGLVLVGLGLAALSLAGLRANPGGAVDLPGRPGIMGVVPPAVGIVVAAEVGAKFGMAALACLGEPAFEGLGSAFTDHSPADLAAPVGVALPAVLFGVHAVAALLGAVVASLALLRWARAHLGGVNGDVFGAANELARLAGLHAGVIAWTLS